MDDKHLRTDRAAGTPTPNHVMTLTNRERMTVTGVLGVESFDDQEIVLETEYGTLTLRGEDLHIKQLDLESAKFEVEGMVIGCHYTGVRGGRSAGRPRNKSLFERLLK
jgi:sporulation protein YabP